MDTTGDGVIDDFLAVKKRGRKSLGLNKEEMKVRRELQRKARVAKKREEKRKQDIERLITEVMYLKMNGKNKDEIIMSIFKDAKFTIYYDGNKTALSGVCSERIKRYRVKESV